MAETTEQYRTRINQLKTGIENEPYIKEMREDIAEGISKTGNRQADIEVRQDKIEDDFVAVQQDARSNTPSGAELAVAAGEYNTLGERLNAEKQKVNAQLAQTGYGLSKNPTVFREKQSYDGFFDQNKWSSKTGNGAYAGEWTFLNGTAKPNESDSEHILWYDQKVSDGKIEFVWENPTLSETQQVGVGVVFRGLSAGTYLKVLFFSGGVRSVPRDDVSQMVVGYVYENGIRKKLLPGSIKLTSDETKFKEGVPTLCETEFVSSTINVRINGVLVTSISDPDVRKFNFGHVGITSFDSVEYNLNKSNVFSRFSITEYKYDTYPVLFDDMLFCGDSIAKGEGASSLSKSWSYLFEERIKKDVNSQFDMVNIGVGGQNTSEVYNTLTSHINSQTDPFNIPYDFVLVACGTNNLRIDSGKGRTIEQTLQDLTSIIKIIKGGNAIPIIATPPHVDYNVSALHPTNYDSEAYNKLANIVGAIKQLAKIEGIRVVDNYELIVDPNGLVDGVHPDDKTYELMANNLFETIYQ